MSATPRQVLATARSTGSYTCNACRHSRSLAITALTKPRRLLTDSRSRSRSHQSPLRSFYTSPGLLSGHNKWSSIKHDKGKADLAKNKARSIFSGIIATESKYYGADPNSNPRLVVAINNAKKAGVPKAVIESAIARGQGISASGAALESVTVEAIISSSVAIIIDCQTESKLRTLMDIRMICKDYGATVTPTSYLFEKKGRIVFQEKEGVSVDEVMDAALEAGALDIEEDEDGKVVVFTETNDTKGTAQSLAASLGLEIESSDIIWDPNEDTKVELNDVDAAKNLASFLEKLQDVSEVQGVYVNLRRGLDEEISRLAA